MQVNVSVLVPDVPFLSESKKATKSKCSIQANYAAPKDYLQILVI